MKKKNRAIEKWLEIIIYILLAIVLIGLSVCLIILTAEPGLPLIVMPFLATFFSDLLS